LRAECLDRLVHSIPKLLDAARSPKGLIPARERPEARKDRDAHGPSFAAEEPAVFDHRFVPEAFSEAVGNRALDGRS
jgi:hypothetical protein